MIFIGTNSILFGNPVGNNWNYENVGKRSIFISFELRNTGTGTILIQFWTEKYWNTNQFDSVLNWEILEHEPVWWPVNWEILGHEPVWSLVIHDGRTGGRTDGLTGGRTDGRYQRPINVNWVFFLSCHWWKIRLLELNGPYLCSVAQLSVLLCEKTN